MKSRKAVAGVAEQAKADKATKQNKTAYLDDVSEDQEDHHLCRWR